MFCVNKRVSNASPTAEKTARRAAPLDTTNPYKRFFQKMYPDNKCHACAKKQIQVKEDTDHMLSCPSREDRSQESVKLWQQVYKIIGEAKIEDGKAKGKPQYIKPFVVRTPAALALHEAPPNGALAFPCVGRVAQFPDQAAALGLIPRDLVGVLRELGLAEPDKVADKVARLCQNAVVADLKARHHAIAMDRDQKSLFRRYVLRVPPNHA